MPRTKKLTADQKNFIMRQIGCNFRDCDIYRNLLERYPDLKVGNTLIRRYRELPENQSAINKFRKSFESEIIAVELASKRRRVEELNKIYHILYENEKYDSAMKSLHQIQLELEGAGKTEVNYSYNQYINLSNDEIKQKLYENAKKLIELEGKPQGGQDGGTSEVHEARIDAEAIAA